jgi:VWFA-related protein
MRTTRPGSLALLLAATLSVPADLPAQEKRLPSFGAEVTVVSIPVYVTGKDGKAVPGLTPEDFEVQDDGKPAKVLAVHEIDVTAPLPEMSFRAASAARRQFLLLFDLSFTSVAGLVRARQAAQRFALEQLAPNDLAAAATISVNTGLRMLVGFTSDREQLRRAIDSLGFLNAERRSDPLGLVFDSSPGFGSSTEGSGRQGGRSMRDEELAEQVRVMQLQYNRAAADDYRQRVGNLMKALSGLTRALDAVQGRKQLLYFSAGINDAAMAGETGQQATNASNAVTQGRIWEVETDARFGDSTLRDKLAETLRTFNTADVVVHAIDVTGLQAGGDLTTQESSEGFAGSGSGANSLNAMAEETGGRFVRNSNDLNGALGEILEATRRYYIVTFEPPALKGADKPHKLKVKVRGGGREASSRTAWAEASADQATTGMTPTLQAAEAIAKGLTGGEIRIEAVAVPYRNAEGGLSVPVVLQVDAASLLAGRSSGNLTVDVFAYAMDANGAVEDLASLAPTLELAKLGSKLTTQGLQVHTAFKLKPGQKSLRFLVRDREKGRRGFATIPVTLPSFEPGTVTLSAPMFMDDPAARLVLQVPSRESGTLDMPFRVDTDLFTPRLKPSLANGRTDNVCVMFYAGGASYPPGTQFEIKAQLLDGDGNAVRIGKMALSKAVAETDGFRRFVLGVTPAEVPAGDYTFRVRIKDPATGQVAEGEEAVRFQ